MMGKAAKSLQNNCYHSSTTNNNLNMRIITDYAVRLFALDLLSVYTLT